MKEISNNHFINLGKRIYEFIMICENTGHYTDKGHLVYRGKDLGDLFIKDFLDWVVDSTN